MQKSQIVSPFSIPNIRLFIAFRIFFNSRFYYPVFSILFLDFGLTLSQFAILNAVWAATIVLCEVPSGALADSIGRKKLLVFTGILMVFEMAIIAFVPRDDVQLLFMFFLINRVLSGVAEASASGADEALAYDSLCVHGSADDWGAVLEKQMRIQSVGFIFAMVIGAAVYDPALMQTVADWAGINAQISKDVTIRFPIYLTLVFAVLTLLTTLMMKDVPVKNENGDSCDHDSDCVRPVMDAFRITLKAGRWILATPFVLIAILFGLHFDSVIRMVITMSSQYYRIIEIPEAFLGIIGSAMAVMGVFIPGIARKMTENLTPLGNLLITAIIAMTGLIGMCFFFPVFGLFPALLLFSCMFFLGFFLSHYLNQATGSDQRATVLSFKGLSFNLAYGTIGILYSFLLSFLRSGVESTASGMTGETLKNQVFIDSMAWFPWYLGIGLVILFIFASKKLKPSGYRIFRR